MQEEIFDYVLNETKMKYQGEEGEGSECKGDWGCVWGGG